MKITKIKNRNQLIDWYLAKRRRQMKELIENGVKPEAIIKLENARG